MVIGQLVTSGLIFMTILANQLTIKAPVGVAR